MALRYISIRQIADNLKDHSMLKDISLERIVNHTINFIRTLGLAPQFEEKVETVEVDNYRAKLPCDLYNIIQVRTTCHHHTFVAATNSFHFGEDQHFPQLTYKVQDGYIYTSIEHGNIDIAYNSIKVDKEGFPMLPDDSTFTEALELYIKKKKFTVLYDEGKIEFRVLHNVQQEYAAAVKLCQSRFNTPTYDEMESLANMLTRLLPSTHQHESGFINEGLRERRKI